jgi:hypothetical protein
MNVMWHTMRLAVWDLLAFSALISLVFIAYTILGYLAFGQYIRCACVCVRASVFVCAYVRVCVHGGVCLCSCVHVCVCACV